MYFEDKEEEEEEGGIAMMPMLDFLNHRPKEETSGFYDPAMDAFIIKTNHHYRRGDQVPQHF